MRCRRPRQPSSQICALLLLVISQAGPSHALPLIDNDRHSLNVDGSLKSFLFLQNYWRFDDALRDALGLADGPWGGTAAADIRLKLEGEHGEQVKWQLHLRSQPQLNTFSNAASALGFVSAARPPRLLPLEITSPSGSTFQWHHEIDRLNVALRLDKVDIILGRQAISFGVGFVWLPADLVGTFSPLELDQEYKPGVDALRINIAFGDFTELALVGALGGPRCAKRPPGSSQDNSLPDGSDCSPGDVRMSSQHSVALARFRTDLWDWDIGLLSGWVRGDIVGGAFTTGSFGNLRLRSEAVLTWDLQWDDSYAGSGNPQQAGDVFVRAVLGSDYQFDTEQLLIVLAEFYYNGFGSLDSDDYAELLTRPRVSEFGEIFNVGQFYLALGAQWEPHEKLPLGLTLMSNLHDPSLLLSLTVTYKVGDESELVVGAQIPVGRTPRLDATSPGLIVARSEFGLYPDLYYLIWKAYF